jgi:hypothetical protein
MGWVPIGRVVYSLWVPMGTHFAAYVYHSISPQIIQIVEIYLTRNKRERTRDCSPVDCSPVGRVKL